MPLFSSSKRQSKQQREMQEGLAILQQAAANYPATAARLQDYTNQFSNGTNGSANGAASSSNGTATPQDVPPQYSTSQGAPPRYKAVEPFPAQDIMNMVFQDAERAGVSNEVLTKAFATLSLQAANDNHTHLSPDMCLAHLKLLEAFYALKDEVAYTDGAFGIFDARAPGSEESVAGNEAATRRRLEALAQIRELRWALYVARAVDRFETWWTTVLVPTEPGGATRLRLMNIVTTYPMPTDDGYYSTFTNTPPDQGLRWQKENLPPLGKTIPFLVGH
jgi:hypothetical protein